MTDYYLPDDEPAEDVSYENFDDMLWEEAGELEPIDLAALDDDLPARPEPIRPEDALSAATEDLLDTLDDALPSRYSAPTPEERSLAAFAAPPASLAEDTDDFLAALDDDLPAGPEPIRPEDALSAATEDLLDTLDDALAPSIAAGPALAPAPRLAPIPAARGTTARQPVARPPAEPVYQVLLALPPELGAQVLELRATGDVEDMPPPGIPLTPRFFTPDADALDAALERWARARLPLTVEIAGVQAEILGERQYVAAWTVTLDDRLRAALHALKRSLSGLVQPLPDEPGTLRLRVTIGERIPARRYPHVLALMQRDFEPAQWPVQTLMLAVYAGDDAPPDWDIAAIYAGEAPPSAV